MEICFLSETTRNGTLQPWQEWPLKEAMFLKQSYIFDISTILYAFSICNEPKYRNGLSPKQSQINMTSYHHWDTVRIFYNREKITLAWNSIKLTEWNIWRLRLLWAINVKSNSLNKILTFVVIDKHNDASNKILWNTNVYVNI